LSRDASLRIEDALAAAEEAYALVADLDLAGFLADRKVCLAVERLLFVMGEAMARLSPEYQAAHRELPWREAIGLRNQLAHGYFSIEAAILWRTVREDLPPFITQLKTLLDGA
jgi:uncharacterized protein with HEPN domain